MAPNPAQARGIRGGGDPVRKQVRRLWRNGRSRQDRSEVATLMHVSAAAGAAYRTSTIALPARHPADVIVQGLTPARLLDLRYGASVITSGIARWRWDVGRAPLSPPLGHTSQQRPRRAH